MTKWEAVEDMDKAIFCLRYEVPAGVWMDVNERWQNLKDTLYESDDD